MNCGKYGANRSMDCLGQGMFSNTVRENVYNCSSVDHNSFLGKGEGGFRLY